MAAYYVNKPPDGEPPPRRRGPPIPGEEDAIACVPYVPWRCPSCGEAERLRTYGRRGRVRYHECPCGLRFRSIEVEPQQVASLNLKLDEEI